MVYITTTVWSVWSMTDLLSLEQWAVAKKALSYCSGKTSS